VAETAETAGEEQAMVVEAMEAVKVGVVMVRAMVAVETVMEAVETVKVAVEMVMEAAETVKVAAETETEVVAMARVMVVERSIWKAHRRMGSLHGTAHAERLHRGHILADSTAVQLRYSSGQ